MGELPRSAYLRLAPMNCTSTSLEVSEIALTGQTKITLSGQAVSQLSGLLRSEAETFELKGIGSVL